MSVKIGRNDPCWCKSGRKYKACHQAFDEKIAAIAAQGHIVPTHDIIKNADQIAGIKESCKINIAVLDYIQEHIHEGMNTAEIDKIVYDMTTSMGGIPAPLHYQGYPYSVHFGERSGVPWIPVKGCHFEVGRYYQRGCFHDFERLFFRFFQNVLHRRRQPGEETSRGCHEGVWKKVSQK